MITISPTTPLSMLTAGPPLPKRKLKYWASMMSAIWKLWSCQMAPTRFWNQTKQLMNSLIMQSWLRIQQIKFIREVVLCEIFPLKDLLQNKDKNVIIDKFNKSVNEYITDEPFYKVLALSKMIKHIPQNNSKYHDNVHLNYRNGNPWLKNQILAQLMLTSNGMCQINEPDK